jgi:hypothetical protein
MTVPMRACPVATWTSYTETVTRMIWRIPADKPWGACWTELDKVLFAVQRKLQELGREMTDDAIRVHPGDDEILIVIDLETVTAPA